MTLKHKKGGITSLELKVFPYAMILPNLLIFTLFIAVPLVLGIYYSLTTWKGIGTPVYVGLGNYIKIFKDKRFWASFLATAKFTLCALPFTVAVPLALATLMIKNVRLRAFFRAAYYWPSMISYIITGLTFKFIFGESTGVINYLLQSLGFGKVELLTSPVGAIWIVVLATVWSTSGSFMVNYIAGLQNISDSYYEAATVDGASKVQQFWHVTVPLLRPTIFLVFMLGFLGLFKSYGLVISMTKGGPAGATRFVVQYVYDKAFQNVEMGYASALSVILTIILSIVTVIFFWLSKGGRINDE